MSNHLFVCNKCGKHTPLVQKYDKLPPDIEHHYAECQQCGYKSTIYYINTEVKLLMHEQQRTNFGTNKKRKLTDKITKLTQELLVRYGG